MTSWEYFGGLLRDILITYYFGNQTLFYSSIVVVFMIALLMAGLEFRQTILFTLPLVAVLGLNGAFGVNTWVVSLFLLAVAFVYAYIIMDLFT